MARSSNCAYLVASGSVVDSINSIVQIYSGKQIFYLGKPPTLTQTFLQDEFLELKHETDGFIELLDEVAGIRKHHGDSFSGF